MRFGAQHHVATLSIPEGAEGVGVSTNPWGFKVEVGPSSSLPFISQTFCVSHVLVY